MGDEFLLVVDQHLDVTAGQQFGLGDHDHRDQRKNDEAEHPHGNNEFVHNRLSIDLDRIDMISMRMLLRCGLQRGTRAAYHAALHQSLMPAKAMKAIAIRPVTAKVAPNPRTPAGGLL